MADSRTKAAKIRTFGGSGATAGVKAKTPEPTAAESTKPEQVTMCLAGAELSEGSSAGNQGFEATCDRLPGVIRDRDKSIFTSFLTSARSTLYPKLFAALDTNKDGQLNHQDRPAEVNLLGYSWGGVAATEVADALLKDPRVAPERREISKLVVVDPYQPLASVKVPAGVKTFREYRHSEAPKDDCSDDVPLGPFTGTRPECAVGVDCVDYDFSRSPDVKFEAEGGYTHHGRAIDHCTITNFTKGPILDLFQGAQPMNVPASVAIHRTGQPSVAEVTIAEAIVPKVHVWAPSASGGVDLNPSAGEVDEATLSAAVDGVSHALSAHRLVTANGRPLQWGDGLLRFSGTFTPDAGSREAFRFAPDRASGNIKILASTGIAATTEPVLREMLAFELGTYLGREAKLKPVEQRALAVSLLARARNPEDADNVTSGFDLALVRTMLLGQRYGFTLDAVDAVSRVLNEKTPVKLASLQKALGQTSQSGPRIVGEPIPLNARAESARYSLADGGIAQALKDLGVPCAEVKGWWWHLDGVALSPLATGIDASGQRTSYGLAFDAEGKLVDVRRLTLDSDTLIRAALRSDKPSDRLYSLSLHGLITSEQLAKAKPLPAKQP